MNTDASTTTGRPRNPNEGHEAVHYRILGSLEVERDGEVVDVGDHEQRALMALLLINANTVVSTDRIIDELWDEGDPKSTVAPSGSPRDLAMEFEIVVVRPGLSAH